MNGSSRLDLSRLVSRSVLVSSPNISHTTLLHSESVMTRYAYVSGNPASEEQAYLEKWKQLQRFIDPLKRMINRIDKDEGVITFFGR